MLFDFVFLHFDVLSGRKISRLTVPDWLITSNGLILGISLDGRLNVIFLRPVHNLVIEITLSTFLVPSTLLDGEVESVILLDGINRVDNGQVWVCSISLVHLVQLIFLELGYYGDCSYRIPNHWLIFLVDTVITWEIGSNCLF